MLQSIGVSNVIEPRHKRQRDDVNLWVAEEPEQVLPENGTAGFRIEDVRPESAVSTQCEQCSGQRRERHQDQQRGDQGVPREDRHTPHGHARCTQADDGGNEVHRTKDGAEARQCQTEDPEVSADARRERGVRQRSVGEPTKAGCTLRGEVAGQGDGRTEGEEPEGQRVQTWEGNVRRANLQRHHDVGETCEERGGEHQEHDGAMHGEQLVVLFLGLQDLHTWFEQLCTDQQRHDATDAEEDERHDQVHVPDLLVVGRSNEVDEEATLGLRHNGWGNRLHVVSCIFKRSHSDYSPSPSCFTITLFTVSGLRSYSSPMCPSSSLAI